MEYQNLKLDQMPQCISKEICSHNIASLTLASLTLASLTLASLTLASLTLASLTLASLNFCKKNKKIIIMKFLITGGCGFLGSNLSAEVMSKGHELFILDNLSRVGSESNLIWLKKHGKFKFYKKDIRDKDEIEKIVRELKPEVIFHLAGQVAMTTSIKDPRTDFDVNVQGGFNILDSARKFSPDSIIAYSSTNKVYGELNCDIEEKDLRYVATDFPTGFDEQTKIDFQGPYGCSKGTIDQYMLDFHRIYGLKTIVFRHSSIFGSRQFFTFDQGWIGWFINEALEVSKNQNKEITISGTGKQVRDLLFTSDLKSCYFKSIENIEACRGEAFNIGGGMQNSLSILELFKYLEKTLDISINYQCLPWRSSDQKIFVADFSKAKSFFDWTPSVNKLEGLNEMVYWVKEIVNN